MRLKSSFIYSYKRVAIYFINNDAKFIKSSMLFLKLNGKLYDINFNLFYSEMRKGTVVVVQKLSDRTHVPDFSPCKHNKSFRKECQTRRFEPNLCSKEE